MKLAAMLVLAIAVVVAPGRVAAQNAKKGAAELLFKDGKRLLADGKTAAACAKFEESQRLDAAIGTLLNLARCYELDGRLATAWQTYLAASKMARQAKDKRRANAARDLAAKLEGRLPRLVVSVTDRPDGLVVKDGTVAFDLTLLDVPVPVDPGTHQIEATAPGYQPFTTSVDLPEGQSVTVTVSMSKVPDVKVKVEPGGGGQRLDGDRRSPPDDADQGDEDDEDDRARPGSPGRGRRITGVSVGAVGLIGVGVATYLAIAAKGDYDGAFDDGHCDPDSLACDADGLKITGDARSQANLATVIGGVGLAAVAAGVVLYLTAPSGRAADEHAYVVPVVGGHSIGVAFGGRL